jgi:hypothetical protein
MTKAPGNDPGRRSQETRAAPDTADYLLAGQASELERLRLQSRIWEPSGRRLLTLVQCWGRSPA